MPAVLGASTNGLVAGADPWVTRTRVSSSLYWWYIYSMPIEKLRPIFCSMPPPPRKPNRLRSPLIAKALAVLDVVKVRLIRA